MRLEMLINKHYDDLNENDLSTLHYIIVHKKKCLNMSITDLSTYCNISKSSILRTTQKLGFSGFSEFKYALKSDLNPEEEQTKDYFKQTIMDIENTLKFFRRTDLSPIYKQLHRAEHIYAYGTGWAQRNAILELKRNFLNCNRMITDVAAKKELEVAIKFITERDLVLIVSLSGEISDIIEDIRLLKIKNVPVLSITNADFNHNELATLVPYNLYYHSSSYNINSGDESGTETVSLVTLSVLCDALFHGYLFGKGNLK